MTCTLYIEHFSEVERKVQLWSERGDTIDVQETLKRREALYVSKLFCRLYHRIVVLMAFLSYCEKTAAKSVFIVYIKYCILNVI